MRARPELAHVFIELRGDLGAGKTTFTRHLLRALGVTGRIKSPSYAVVEAHQAPNLSGFGPVLSIWHFDFYRFNDPREWADAGLRDLFASPGLKLVEWPEQAQGVLPTPDWVLQISVPGIGPATPDPLQDLDPPQDPPRRVRVTALTPAGQALLEFVLTP
jgi:tRNA threonylcarbamoyladenosine biosynthesis protein TsaE